MYVNLVFLLTFIHNILKKGKFIYSIKYTGYLLDSHGSEQIKPLPTESAHSNIEIRNKQLCKSTEQHPPTEIQ